MESMRQVNPSPKLQESQQNEEALYSPKIQKIAAVAFSLKGRKPNANPK